MLKSARNAADLVALRAGLSHAARDAQGGSGWMSGEHQATLELAYLHHTSVTQPSFPMQPADMDLAEFDSPSQ